MIVPKTNDLAITYISYSALMAYMSYFGDTLQMYESYGFEVKEMQ